jgi:hypothetical protein
VPLTHDDLMAQWGADRLIYFPIDEFPRLVAVMPDAFPPDGGMPVEVPILFTVVVDRDGIQLFSVLRVQVGDDSPTELIVLGCAPEEPAILFCLEPRTGAVMLLDTEAPAYELVNTSFAAFVEFLYRLDQLIATDPGGRERAARAARLREDLAAVDPAAFADPESWWSAAFAQLESTA